MNVDMFHIVSDWYCFAILNLAETENFKWDPQLIARRLGLSKLEVHVALERLQRVGLVVREPALPGRPSRLKVSNDFIMSQSGVPSEAIRSYHRQILNKALQSIEMQSLDERDLSGIGLAIDPNDLPSIKKDISEFQEKIAAKYKRGKKSEVYHLEMALFRLTEHVPKGDSK